MAPRLIFVLVCSVYLVACGPEEQMPYVYSLQGEYAEWLKGDYIQNFTAISNLKEKDEHVHQNRNSEYVVANAVDEPKNHYETRRHTMFDGIFPIQFGAELTQYKEHMELNVSAYYSTHAPNPWNTETLSFDLTNSTYERRLSPSDTFQIYPSPFDSVYRALQNHIIAGKTYPNLIQIRFEVIETYGTLLSAPIVYIEPEWGIIAYELNDGRVWTVQK